MVNPARKISPPRKGYDEMPPDIPNLFDAAANNDLKGINAALNHYHINSIDEFGMSALHHAAGYGAIEAIDLLLEYDIDTSITDTFGRLASWVPIEVLGPELGAHISNKLGPYCVNYD